MRNIEVVKSLKKNEYLAKYHYLTPSHWQLSHMSQPLSNPGIGELQKSKLEDTSVKITRKSLFEMFYSN